MKLGKTAPVECGKLKKDNAALYYCLAHFLFETNCHLPPELSELEETKLNQHAISTATSLCTKMNQIYSLLTERNQTCESQLNATNFNIGICEGIQTLFSLTQPKPKNGI